MQTSKLIHVGKVRGINGKKEYVFLRETEPDSYFWFEGENQTDIGGGSTEEAIKQAHNAWKDRGFETLKCGFLYTLPERDEHGINALFHQMVSSYESLQGQYFDPDYGHMCVVQNPSHEALNLWKELKKK